MENVKLMNKICQFIADLFNVDAIWDANVDYKEFIISVKVPNDTFNITYIEQRIEQFLDDNDIPLTINTICAI